MSRLCVEVSLPPPLARELSYGVPAELCAAVGPGSLVLVPVAHRQMTGVALGPPLPADGQRELRDILQIVDDESLVEDEVIELCRWLAEYYFAPLGSALKAALPPGIEKISNRIVHLRAGEKPLALSDPLDLRVVDTLAASGSLKVSVLRRRLGRSGLEGALRRLKRAGHIDIGSVLQQGRVRRRTERCFRPLDRERANRAAADLDRRARRQAQCLRLLLEKGELGRRQLQEQGFGDGIVAALVKKGLVERVEREVERDPVAALEPQAPLAEMELSADQRRAVAALCAGLDGGQFYPALLQGVTGSGKTLVYIRAVARALALGRGAIVLVPEIALAWQMVRRFTAYFGDQVAVMHSQLSDGERYDTWRRLRQGRQRVVIGARSAILAPVQQLGLIVVDEEHDSSYKQEDLESAHPLSYSARDAALVRGRRQGAVVVLGSATPSLESYWNAQTGKYRLLRLPTRVDDKPLPKVEVVDMRKEPFQRKGKVLFSQLLRQKISDRLQRGEKIVLLQNRRGFAPFVICTSCGETVLCKSCRVSLTFHQGKQNQLRCHYCDYRLPPISACRHCGSAELRLEGVGTQRVEEELHKQFAGIGIIRMDVDTTGWKGAHDTLVERFRRGEADVLLGTQMVAKGLDFPDVTLVGVISADTGMHLPDFRASERSFQLLTQVAGRSGRGQIAGEVVIQTMLPDDAVLAAAARQDFAAFVEMELDERRSAGFPPFGRLAAFRWRGEDEAAVERSAQQGTQHLKQLAAGGTILGPAPAPLARLRGHFRWQALLRGESARQVHQFAEGALAAMQKMARKQKVTLTLNIDPLTLM